MTFSNKGHLSAPTYLNPRTRGTAPSLKNTWEDAVRAPSTQQAPHSGQFSSLGILGEAGQAAEPKLGAGAGGREDTRPLSPTDTVSSGHSQPPPALTPSHQEPPLPPLH